MKNNEKESFITQRVKDEAGELVNDFETYLRAEFAKDPKQAVFRIAAALGASSVAVALALRLLGLVS